MEWSAEEEIKLFFALEGLKPIGVNKHFYMVGIAERLCKSLNREVPSEAIWAHLRTLYNLEVLDQAEPLPFPNEEKDFELPDTEFSTFMSKKRAESEEKEKRFTYEGGPPSIIAVATDSGRGTNSQHVTKDFDKKVAAKLVDLPKRTTTKRTRNSNSLESNSPSTTPPPTLNSKRRRI